MAIYSYQSPHSIGRLSNKIVMIDTSYLIGIADTDDVHANLLQPFHFQATGNGTVFVVNVIVRQEFIKDIRKKILAEAFLTILRENPELEERYRAATNIKTKALSFENIVKNIDSLQKSHAREGDINLLYGALMRDNQDIWKEVQRLEETLGLQYRGGTGNSQDLWDALGAMMKITCMSATDAMIANLAIAINADAILTADSDFVAIASSIDVFMPLDVARECTSYEETADMTFP